MESFLSASSSLFCHVGEYLNIQSESIKLNVAEKTANLFSKLLFAFAFILLFGVFLIFFGTAFACLIADFTGKYYIGFVIVALIFLLACVILWIFRNRFMRLMVMNAVLDQLINETNND
jgi:hypothetical protein